MTGHTFAAVLASFAIAMATVSGAVAGELGRVHLFEIPAIVVTPTHQLARDQNPIDAIALKTGIVRTGDDLYL